MKTLPVREELREVMDIRQAADYLGISPDTLYKYSAEGFVPAFKLGNRWRFKRSRLDEWMDQRSSEWALASRAEPMAESGERKRPQPVRMKHKRAARTGR